ncbi:hypothetical protein NQ314_006967 [Rhamnusium bicolor]|uniref:PiggyBac transposable element-derived protein domain-containing protein n=1 Tax=Rhamnusium bicolor TaxID=1586634 RepID=A0AAV8YUD8_9CUCU|nr:hypothetical protein NQ314_006967 [Rhamnusium bicolor]
MYCGDQRTEWDDSRCLLTERPVEYIMLLQLLHDVDTDEELPNDEEEDGVSDHIEERMGDSETEQEAESENEESESGKKNVDHVRTGQSNLRMRLPMVKGIPRDLKNSLECWQLFFTDEMLISMVDNTNKYIDSISDKYTRNRDARPTNLSMHFDDAIDKNTHEQNKPEIITFYNSTKSGVDVVDKLGATYNCARNTQRWTMVILYVLMNVEGINSQIIHTAINPLINMKRRDYLKTIAHEQIDEHLKYRSMLTNVLPSVKRRCRCQEVDGTSQEHPQQPVEGSRKKM